jgi:hypothetical protein
MRRTLVSAVFTACLCMAVPADADTTVTVDQNAPWLGFINFFELPSNGGAYVFGSGWAVPDLVAVFDDPSSDLTLYPTPIGTSDSFWYVGGVGMPGAQGNKIAEANLYVEVTDGLGGQTVTFDGSVLSNTLVSPYTSVAFIKDFAPDYSSFNVTSVPLTPGAFSISLATSGDPGRHVQYGFTTTGPNVFPTDIQTKGNVVIATVIPEPASVLLAAMAAIACVGLIRPRRQSH